MARRLLESGLTLVVHNRSRAVVSEFQTMGAQAATCPREVAEQVDVVFTALNLPSAVEQVLLGPDGVVQAARPGLITVDHSTIPPDLCRRLATSLAAHGIWHLDAPVSGGPERAALGELSIMVGGRVDAFERVAPLLRHLGNTVSYCGPSGNGLAVKLVNQVLVAVNSIAAAEALLFAKRCGLDLKLALEAASAGLGASAMLTRNGQRMLERDFAPGARIELLVKDMAIVRALCGELSLELPTFFEAKRAFEAAFEQGNQRLDLAAVATTVNAAADRRPPVLAGPGVDASDAAG